MISTVPKAIALLLIVGAITLSISESDASPRQEEGAQDTADAESSPAEAAQDAVPDSVPPEEPVSITPLARFATLDARLSALAAERPNWFEMRTLATSAEGRPLRLAIVGERERSEPGEKPALLLLPSLGDASLDRPETLVRLLEELAAKIATDPNTPSLLQRTTLYVLPAPLPDLYALEPGAPAPGPSPTLDFPVGWLPWIPESPGGEGAATLFGSLRPGPYPLSRPETLALVDFLYWNSNVASVLEVQAPGAVSPAQPKGGSLRAFCESALGLSYLYSEKAEDGRTLSLAERSLEMLAALPDLRIDPPEVSPLAEDLWLVEVRIANSGTLPRAEKALPAFVRVEGALLRTAMVRPDGQASFHPVPSDRGGRIEVGPLVGGTAHTLRVVLEAAESTEVALRLRSALGGRAERSVRLTKE